MPRSAVVDPTDQRRRRREHPRRRDRTDETSTAHEILAEAERDDPIELPPPWSPPPRPPFPMLASVVPLAGAVGLWLVTGSILSLWLALLGPVIAVATLADGARSTRRARRLAARESARALGCATAQVELRQRAERARLRARHPDVATYLAHDDEVWRPVPGRFGQLVVGRGRRSSGVRVSGGGDDAASVALRTRARTLDDAPVTTPLVGGIAVSGPDALTAAVLRALVAQLCLTHPPGEVRVVGGVRGSWLDGLPHCRSSGAVTVAVLSDGEVPPPDADALLIRTRRGAPPPPGCAAVLTIDSPGVSRLDCDGEIRELAAEAISAEQFADIAALLVARAHALGHRGDDERPVRLAEHLPVVPRERADGLLAVLGMQGEAECAVDLVADGPHAIVAGVTGSGKSELLITWVLALCAGRSTRDLGLLLADFKGGTAFDALAGLPHVTGVITDLDGGGARRAIESLRAEVRWREAELARSGARDIRDPRVELPRLVIVVDEFAALLGTHPELQAVFTDVAARGRALGMHLILGTQRVAGIVRESLLANVPLRISLRVTDAADSRAVIGTDGAALLPGGAAGAGRALLRRSSDAAPHPVRIALATAEDIAVVAACTEGPVPRRPWLPDLPEHLCLDDLPAASDDIVLGVVDEPEHQRQSPAALAATDQGLLVLGGAGSGRSTVLETIAAQASGRTVRVAADGEGGWDALARLDENPPAAGTVVLVDDLDTLAGALPHEYALVLLGRLERLIRSAGATGILVAVTLRRLSGPAARVAELLPRRLLLRTPLRADHVAAGGDGAHHAADAPPGRGRLDGRAIQIASARASTGGGDGFVHDPLAATAAGAQAVAAEEWRPTRPTAVLARRSAALRAVLAAWSAAGVTAVSVDDAARIGPAALTSGPTLYAVVGGLDEWQRHGTLLTLLRGDHDLLVDAGCAPEYRVLTGDRELPPYCAPGRPRGWLRTADGPVRRVILPGAAPPASIRS